MLARFGIAVAIGFIAASAVMNFMFGHALGRSPLEAIVYGGAGVLAVVTNALCPFLADAARRARRLALLAAVITMWILCLVFSLTGALGFAADNRQSRVASLSAAQEVLRSKLATLGDLEAAKRSPRIEGRIHALRGEIEVLRMRGAGTEPDPQAALIGALFGFSSETARIVLLALFSLMIEAGAAIVLFAALATRASGRDRQPKPTTKPAVAKPVWNPGNKAGATGR